MQCESFPAAVCLEIILIAQSAPRKHPAATFPQVFPVFFGAPAGQQVEHRRQPGDNLPVQAQGGAKALVPLAQHHALQVKDPVDKQPQKERQRAVRQDLGRGFSGLSDADESRGHISAGNQHHRKIPRRPAQIISVSVVHILSFAADGAKKDAAAGFYL